MPDLPLFLLLLLVLAALFRNDVIFYIFYLFAGLYILGAVWVRRALPSVRAERRADDYLYLGERREVELVLTNGSRLPLPWLQVVERLPVEFNPTGMSQAVVALAGGASERFRYTIAPTRRGYYHLGPLQLRAGDVLGIGPPLSAEIEADAVVVYPKIVPLAGLGVVGGTPFGRLAHPQRLFEDPARLLGTRDYQAGDSPRQIHWKASAALGRWQTKQFEPAISLVTLILLNMSEGEYPRSRWASSSELGVTAAASLAHAISEAGQAVGLLAYGGDPLAGGTVPPVLAPRTGRGHLMLILEQLARISLVPLPALFAEQLRPTGYQTPWGATIIVITPDATEEIFAAAYSLRRAGFRVTLALTDPQHPPSELHAQARTLGLALSVIDDEEALAHWPGGAHAHR